MKHLTKTTAFCEHRHPEAMKRDLPFGARSVWRCACQPVRSSQDRELLSCRPSARTRLFRLHSSMAASEPRLSRCASFSSQRHPSEWEAERSGFGRTRSRTAAHVHKPVPGSTRTLCVTKVPHALTLPVEAHGPDGRPVLVLSAIDTLPSYRRRGLARDAIVVKGPLYALCTPLLSPPPISRLL
jgi:hypothetical protein